MKSNRQWAATNRIKTREPFKKLFPVEAKTVDAIAEHMRINGYDESQPIIIWDQSKPESKHALYVIDGHTRLLAAKKAGLSPVYVARMSFPDDKTALQYAIHNQRDRRNLNDADILRCIEMLDKRKEAQKDDTGKFAVGPSEPTGRTADTTASIIGTSSTKVKKARTVLDHADDETKEAVKSGQKSIHKAYTETRAKRKGVDSYPKSLNNYHNEFYDKLLEVRIYLESIMKLPEWKDLKDIVLDDLNKLLKAVEGKIDIITFQNGE